MYWDDEWSPVDQEKKSRDGTTAKTANTEVEFNREAPSGQLITLGPALVEAHKLESEVAIYPRLIFSPHLLMQMQRLLKLARRNNADVLPDTVDPFPLYMGKCVDLSPSLLDFVRTDSDGVPFLDMFHKDIDRNDTLRIERVPLTGGEHGIRWIRDEMTHDKFMRETRNRLEGHLNAQDREKVRVKYLWLASYFNNSLEQLSIKPLSIKWVFTDD